MKLDLNFDSTIGKTTWVSQKQLEQWKNCYSSLFLWQEGQSVCDPHWEFRALANLVRQTMYQGRFFDRFIANGSYIQHQFSWFSENDPLKGPYNWHLPACSFFGKRHPPTHPTFGFHFWTCLFIFTRTWNAHYFANCQWLVKSLLTSLFYFMTYLYLLPMEYYAIEWAKTGVFCNSIDSKYHR